MDVSSGSPRSSSRHSLRFDLSCYALALAVIVAVGALNIIYPFVADQVIALTAARTLDQGGVLYVDFWDNKMPGLFWFYRIAGELFGYDETGVHTLELIWMTAFAVIMMAACVIIFITLGCQRPRHLRSSRCITSAPTPST